MKGKILIFFLVLVSVTSLVFTGISKPASAEVTQLSLGATASASGYYAWCVAQAQVVNKHAPGINVTLVGGGLGGIAMAKQVRDGIVDWAAMGTLSIPYNMYHGKGPFKGNRWEPIRLFFMREIMVYRMYVRADRGAKKWTDLTGKRFNPGTPGSTNARNTATANDVLGTGITLVPGTVADAVKGIKEGRLVGMNKSSPVGRFDAGMMEVHYGTPLTVVGFTKEEADKIRAKNPLIFFREAPTGSIKELPKLGSILEMSSIGLTLTSSRMPEDVGYRVIKALHQNWGEVAKGYPPVGAFDPIADFIKAIPQGLEVPLHTGVVRYAKEIGIEIPKPFIPPEYKGAK